MDEFQWEAIKSYIETYADLRDAKIKFAQASQGLAVLPNMTIIDPNINLLEQELKNISDNVYADINGKRTDTLTPPF